MEARKKSLAVAGASVLVAVLLPAGAAQAATTAAAGVQFKLAHSSKCLNVQGASVDNAAKIVQYTCTTAATVTNDKFKLVPRGNDRYWIQGIGSGKCLNVQGGSTANGALIIQYSCGDVANTQWLVDEVPGQSTYRFYSASSGKCLNLPNAVTTDNIQLIQYTCTAAGAANEKFFLPPTGSPTPTKRTFTSRQPIAAIQGKAPGTGGVGPFYFSWVDADNQVNALTDFDPDPYGPENPDAQVDWFGTETPTGYYGRPAVAKLQDGRVLTVAHDAAAGDLAVFNQNALTTGNFTGPWDMGGAFGGQPTVGPIGGGVLASYAIVSGSLWYSPQELNNARAAYGAWRQLGGSGLTGQPVVTATSTGARIVALTTAGTVQTATLSGTTLSDWVDLGGTGLNGTPSVVTTGTQVSIFVRGADGVIVTKKQNADGSFPAAWSPIPGFVAAGSPSAVLDTTPGRIAVTIRGADGQIYFTYETAQGAGTYTDWFQVSNPAQDPAAASDPTAFAYDVPSGASFGVVVYPADDSKLPYYWIFEPSAAAGAKAKTNAKNAVPQPKAHQLPKVKKQLVKD